MNDPASGCMKKAEIKDSGLIDHELVAGERNAPNAPSLIIPFRFELIREVAA
jgi:hypothetical protein